MAQKIYTIKNTADNVQRVINMITHKTNPIKNRKDNVLQTITSNTQKTKTIQENKLMATWTRKININAAGESCMRLAKNTYLSPPL